MLVLCSFARLRLYHHTSLFLKCFSFLLLVCDVGNRLHCMEEDSIEAALQKALLNKYSYLACGFFCCVLITQPGYKNKTELSFKRVQRWPQSLSKACRAPEETFQYISREK